MCPLCDCIPSGIEKRIGERPYKLLWEHIAEHLKSLAFLSLTYVGNDLENRASITDSSKTSDKDDPRISRDSLGNRDLENFDDIPSTTVYSKGAQVEGEDFYEEASLSESENWDFLSVKSLPTDYKYLKKHLTRSQVSLESDIDSYSKHCRDTLSLAANTLEQELPHGDYRGEYNRGLNLFDAPDIDDGLFIGRDTELEQMKTVLLPNPTSPTRKALALGGMGGIGKTQLAGKEKALGPDHTSTLDTVHNLGLLYRDQGKLAEATLHEDHMAENRRIVGTSGTEEKLDHRELLLDPHVRFDSKQLKGYRIRSDAKKFFEIGRVCETCL